MPQLDFSTYLTQFFWVIVTFICFWFIMDKFIVPKLRDTIEERKRKYEDLILKADKINKKALESLKKYYGEERVKVVEKQIENTF